MTSILINSFVAGGIYTLKEFDTGIFLCESVTPEIGKLTFFKEVEPKLFKRTLNSYFLNCYFEGDLKQLFVKRENYEMIGKLGTNYILSNDKKWIKEKENAN